LVVVNIKVPWVEETRLRWVLVFEVCLDGGVLLSEDDVEPSDESSSPEDDVDSSPTDPFLRSGDRLEGGFANACSRSSNAMRCNGLSSTFLIDMALSFSVGGNSKDSRWSTFCSSAG